VISPSQGRYLYTGQHKRYKRIDRQTCLECDSNPQSQRSSGRKQFMPSKARLLRLALTEFKHIKKHMFVRMGKKCTPASGSSTLPRRTRPNNNVTYSPQHTTASLKSVQLISSLHMDICITNKTDLQVTAFCHLTIHLVVDLRPAALTTTKKL
jgi:hypothetical protein